MIDNSVECFQTLVAGIANDLDAPVCTLPMLSRAANSKKYWLSGTKPQRLIHSLSVSMSCCRAGTKDAGRCCRGLVGKTSDVPRARSSRQRIGCAAAHLGVEADMLVGLYVERSMEMLIGMLGTLKAGAAFPLLDLADQPERVVHMLSDADAVVLLAHAELADALPSHFARGSSGRLC